MNKKYDLIVIGGGPGGYVAAIQGAQQGLKTAIVEKKHLGGTCLHVGCIPTKALISNAHVYEMIMASKRFGITVKGVEFDYHKMKERKDQVVSQMYSGLTGLVKSHGIDVYQGMGSFTSPNSVKVLGDNAVTIEFDKAIIATGSESTKIPAFPIDKVKIHDSSSILEMTKLPKRLVVLGGGYIGLEFASLFHALGVEITVVEFLDGLVKNQGKTVSNYMKKAFEQKGVTLKLGVKMESVDTKGNGITAHLSDGLAVEGDSLLVCVGRSPYTKDLSLEKAGVFTNEKGFISVNQRMETSVDHIFAIGDVTGNAMLAHVASHEGIVAANNAAGIPTFAHYNAVPAVIFTTPEIATVGLTEEQAREAGYDVATAQFPNVALGKAVAADHTEGFSELVFVKKTGQILGATLIGYEAGNMIGEMAVAINNELTIECIADTIHPHPTMGEGWMELAHVATGMPIHVPKRH